MDKVDSYKKEVLWKKALRKTDSAIAKGSLIPLETVNLTNFGSAFPKHFIIRKLLPNDEIVGLERNKQINPFLPYDKELEIQEIGKEHALILNKYPVELGHMLLITKDFRKQDGWLEYKDWHALSEVDKDTSGLWFFNSSKIAGASQKHRHLQLLRRDKNEISCPRSSWFKSMLTHTDKSTNKLEDNTYVVDISGEGERSTILYKAYQELICLSGLGSIQLNPKPNKAYNIIISSNWMALIKRTKEFSRGFNINALGFAGYLLATKKSDIGFLECNGPTNLLEDIVS